MRCQALLELCRRYWQIFKPSWSICRKLIPVDHNNFERAFLPAALELQESPSHPCLLPPRRS